jgi:hypothetical protein
MAPSLSMNKTPSFERAMLAAAQIADLILSHSGTKKEIAFSAVLNTLCLYKMVNLFEGVWCSANSRVIFSCQLCRINKKQRPSENQNVWNSNGHFPFPNYVRFLMVPISGNVFKIVH